MPTKNLISSKNVLINLVAASCRPGCHGISWRHGLWFALGIAGVCLNHTGINGKSFSLDKPCVHALAHTALKDLAKDVAVPEAAMPIDREGRMVRHCISVASDPNSIAAQEYFQEWLADQAPRAQGLQRADRFLISDALDLYGEHHAKTLVAPECVG